LMGFVTLSTLCFFLRCRFFKLFIFIFILIIF
jgi:hypothetical protein